MPMPMPLPMPMFLIPLHLRRLALTWRMVGQLRVGRMAHGGLLPVSDRPLYFWPSPTRETMTAIVGAPVVSRLEAIRALRDAGGYPDDCLPHLDTRRLAFARWLISHGRLTDGDIP